MNDSRPPRFKNNSELISFLYSRIRARRKWWLLPFLLILMGLAYFLNLAGKESVLPALYFIF